MHFCDILKYDFDYNLPRILAISATSLSPLPDTLITTILSLSSSPASFMPYAMAWELSIAGIIASTFENLRNASMASWSVATTYCALPLSL